MDTKNLSIGQEVTNSQNMQFTVVDKKDTGLNQTVTCVGIDHDNYIKG